ncbi:MAG: nucleotide-diphospho-sugar transferase [Rectinemataceae bacterium]
MLKTPVLFVVFNRANTVKMVFDAIRSAKPERLFIAADGPRDDVSGEYEKCSEVRQYILDAINWACSVKTLFRAKNLGCGKAVSEAISWFFSEVSEGIIIEDDCLPSEGFFLYCEEMLERYRDDERIMHIAGHNPLGVLRVGTYSYYFARNQHCWGWASWRRAWAKYSYMIGDLNDFVERQVIQRIFDGKEAQEYWVSIFAKMANLEIDTWDYQWTYTIFKNEGYCINPVKNLVTNLGFNGDGTHTRNRFSVFSNQKRYEIKSLRHPVIVAVDPRIIRKINDVAFDLDERTLSKVRKRVSQKIRKLVRIIIGE